MPSIVSSKSVIVETPGTLVPFGLDTLHFHELWVFGKQNGTTNNAGNVRVYSDDGGGSVYQTLIPGGRLVFKAPTANYHQASKFQVDADEFGDGVFLIYTTAHFKTHNNIEAKLEEAFVGFLSSVSATLDDCQFTTGISDDELTANHVVVYCESAEERVLGSVVWDCRLNVRLYTSVDSDNARERHKLKAAYIRDIICDTQLPDLINSFAPNMTVLGVHNRAVSQAPEGRMFVSEMGMNVVCMGANVKKNDEGGVTWGDTLTTFADLLTYAD